LSTSVFLLRELLGAVRPRSALFLGLTLLSVFVLLASFASFFLLGTAVETADSGGLAPDEVVVRLSPRLSAAAIDGLYLRLQERPDVARIRFQFAQEIAPGETGGRFTIRTTSPEAASAVVEAVRVLSGVTSAERGSAPEPTGGILLSTTTRIALLCGLVASVALSLVAARKGFRHLLRGFAGEIRLLRLAGVSERVIQRPVIGLGLGIGCFACVLFVLGVYLLHLAAISRAGDAVGVTDAGRVLAVSVIGSVLGIVVGTLIGVYGASIVSSREFRPLA